MSNDELQRSVTAELIWDRKVDDNEIAVSADEGVVTLRGTVGSLREKYEAKKDAERVYGVKHVKNDLDVRIMNDEGRADANLRRDILHALTLDTLVPATIDAQVADGLVTLTGTADRQLSVTNEVRLVAPGPTARDLQASRRAPRWAWVAMTVLTLAIVCLSAGALIYGYWWGQAHARPHLTVPVLHQATR